MSAGGRRDRFPGHGLLGRYLVEHFRGLDAAARAGAPVAWCSSVGPVELLRAMGFAVHLPENHAALLGVLRQAGPALAAARARGFAPGTCSYLAADVGAWHTGRSPLAFLYPAHEGAPAVTAPPRPTLLVACTNQCRDVADWFQHLGRELQVPCLVLPGWRGVGVVSEPQVDGLARELEALVGRITEATGQVLDRDELSRCLARSRATTEAWLAWLALAARRPSPSVFFEALQLMAPAVLGRGTSQAAEFTRALVELYTTGAGRDRVAVPGARVRLYWEGMPIWFALREHERLCAGLGVEIVGSTYASSFAFPALDPRDPWRSLARALTELFVVRDDDTKLGLLAAEVARLGCDGVVFHEARTCPANSNSRYGLPERLRASTGVGTLVLHGDHLDPGLFGAARAATELEAFVESLVASH